MYTLLRYMIFTVCMVVGNVIVFLAFDQPHGDQVPLGAMVSDALIGFLVLLIGAISFASLLSDTMTGFIVKLFGGSVHTRLNQSSPYSEAESLEASGDIEAAIAAYKAIALKDFKDATPYIRMIELAFVTLKDPDRAHSLYIRGLTLISTMDQQRRLEKNYTYFKRISVADNI